ncbi:MAG TPA: PPOX class F420-dependent oxidoreductase [Thermomicrobiales bacterium]|nr:PPOX class F420-dependent oxidoreductase [Thermomicrobiales bacterium]
MTGIPETHLDVIARSQVVTVATNGRDGRPQVTAMWFLADEAGNVTLSINTERQKAKNMQRDPRVSLFFIDPANPYRTVEIRATAKLVPDPDYVTADAVGARYGGGNLREMDKPGESRVAVTFDIEKVNTFGQ